MNRLTQVFDYQRFQQNKRLSAIIDDVQSRYSHVLTEDELDMVSAAGVPGMNAFSEELRDDDDQP